MAGHRKILSMQLAPKKPENPATLIHLKHFEDFVPERTSSKRDNLFPDIMGVFRCQQIFLQKNSSCARPVVMILPEKVPCRNAECVTERIVRIA